MLNPGLWALLADSFWKILLPGLTMTIPLTAISFALAMVIAIAVALVQFANIRVLKQIARFYVWVVRGTPLLVQLIAVWSVPAEFAGLCGLLIAGNLVVQPVQSRLDLLLLL